MIEQFIEIKAANADSLLFYRMGDFYELFFTDAEVAARTLGITLTKRGQHLGRDIPMAGVPVHAANDYLQKLIAAGHRVAVCEQVEDPAEAKKRGGKALVRRDVTRLVTPGTITEENILDPGEPNWLLAVGRVKGEEKPALAWIDISTGAFRTATSAGERLLSDILRIDPREVLVPQTLFEDPDLRPTWDALGRLANPQPNALFESASASDRICRVLSVSTLDGFGQFSRSELSAMGGVVAWVEKTQLGARVPLSPPQREEGASTLFIDAATRTSLELTRTSGGSREGSLLKVIDRTVTGPGARLLAERLAAPLTDPERILRRQRSVTFLRQENALRDGLRSALRGVPDLMRALSRLSLGRGGPRDLGAIRMALSSGRELADRLADVELPEELQSARQALHALPEEIGDLLGKALATDLPLLARDGGFVGEAFDEELDAQRALASDSRRVIAVMQAELAEETAIKTLKIRHNNMLGYYIEVPSSHGLKLTEGEAKARFIHRQTMSNAMRFTTTELADLESRIADAGGRALAIETAIFERLVGAVLEETECLRIGAEALAILDVSAALAELADIENWCAPTIDGSLAFEVECGRHPVVEAALRAQQGDAFIANDCTLSPPQGAKAGALWLLTGPNMGGKSTFLRQNALIAILAQMGAHVPATRATIGIVDRLFSRVGASDDLARGRSTFMVEMVETAAILNQAGERSLVILDEIGRGTSTFDGLSIAWATAEHLHETNRCRAIFATHFHEMTALAETLPRLANVTMRVKEMEGEVIFLHQVGKGAADRSYGVQVARLAGLPKSVLARARTVLERLEAGGASTPGAGTLIDDLPLFSAAIRQAENELASDAAPASAHEALLAMLDGINPDDLSPREALETLYRLKDVRRD
ncbi:DNA mismatch repair protein MutS [Notoacmeibacter ruber]|uniref:DNA mismatch repair protein MutS n=2 Tax=Notoacmeibacter ruber TaxID=2670375 RepID=A0A3L7JG53_9HYPH|nr:DNA mismatch repair protein MutS [Notoacmeibacter ruber]RLQ89295.1 DNA mismatch repair protein MutS [Notoacmeibacter ruber]